MRQWCVGVVAGMSLAVMAPFCNVSLEASKDAEVLSPTLRASYAEYEYLSSGWDGAPVAARE